MGYSAVVSEVRAGQGMLRPSGNCPLRDRTIMMGAQVSFSGAVRSHNHFPANVSRKSEYMKHGAPSCCRLGKRNLAVLGVIELSPLSVTLAG